MSREKMTLCRILRCGAQITQRSDVFYANVRTRADGGDKYLAFRLRFAQEASEIHCCFVCLVCCLLSACESNFWRRSYVDKKVFRERSDKVHVRFPADAIQDDDIFLQFRNPRFNRAAQRSFAEARTHHLRKPLQMFAGMGDIPDSERFPEKVAECHAGDPVASIEQCIVEKLGKGSFAASDLAGNANEGMRQK
jgi:hypothetical protein